MHKKLRYSLKKKKKKNLVERGRKQCAYYFSLIIKWMNDR